MKFMIIVLMFVSGTSSALTAEQKSNLESWNMGFGLGVEQYREKYIDSASIRGDTRIVTIDQTYETRPSAWLTLNWPLSPGGSFGVFAGVKIIDSNAEAFSAFALGPQYSFVTSTNQKISVGVGWVTHGTQTLARGINEGAPLPAEYDDVAFEKGTENSYMLMMAVGF